MTPDNRPTPSTSTGNTSTRHTSTRTSASAAHHDTRPDLHLSQVLAGALAAVTSAVVGSTLGVAGTLAGAAVGSIVATSGGALYTYWFRRTGHRVRAVVVRTGDTVMIDPHDLSPADRAEVVPADPRSSMFPASIAPPQRRRWRLAAAVSVAAFVLGMAAITAFEALAGQPVSSLTTGARDGGTSLGDAFGGTTTVFQPPVTTPSPDPTPSPSNPTPSPSPTPTVTSSPTQSEPTTPPPTDPPTDPPTVDPSGTPTPPPT